MGVLGDDPMEVRRLGQLESLTFPAQMLHGDPPINLFVARVAPPMSNSAENAVIYASSWTSTTTGYQAHEYIGQDCRMMAVRSMKEGGGSARTDGRGGGGGG